MKFATIAALVGVASAVEVEQTNDALIQESQEMEQLCENMDQIDESSLLETEIEESEERKDISGTSK
jgi:L-cystine uptake protein TcyP (sodium:dicarboxylate symporter family)